MSEIVDALVRYLSYYTDALLMYLSEHADALVKHSMDNLIIWSAILSAVVYFGFLLVGLWGSARDIRRLLFSQCPDNLPEFDPKTPSMTTLTAVMSLLGAILSARLLPTPTPTSPSATTLHLPTAEAYIYLNVFFVALLALALLFYFSLGQRLGAYLIADWLILWGAFGIVFSFDLALLELTKFSPLSRAVFVVLVTFALAAVAWTRIQSTIGLFARLFADPIVQTELLPRGLLPRGWRWQVK